MNVSLDNNKIFQLHVSSIMAYDLECLIETCLCLFFPNVHNK